jgi:tryptophan synthase alpha chain
VGGSRGVAPRSNSGEAPGNHPPAPHTGELDGFERIGGAFAKAGEDGRAALMPYMMAGYPDHDLSLAVAKTYVEAGADLVELGVPFSDPLADGPTIHAAATAALARGATLETALEVCASIADRVPVVLMAYANMILARGAAEFARRAADAGAAGVIVPDLPLDEADEIRDALAGADLALVPLLAPTTPAERRARICAAAEGFVYLVSTVGTTGERRELPPGLTELIAATVKEADVPVAVGFGIGTPEQVADVGQVADGVIVGSRLVRAAGEMDAVDAVANFLRASLAELGGKGLSR